MFAMNSYTHVKNVYRSCLQNISFVNLKPHPAELIN